MPKFKIIKLINSNIFLSDLDIDHIIKSLRKKKGDIIFCNDDSFEYTTEILSIEKFKLGILNKLKIKNDILDINIYLGLIKKNNFELAVQKLNEINCKTITPVLFDRSQHNILLNKKRINKIILESSKQCGRYKDINLKEEIIFEEMINLIKNNYINILAYQNSDKLVDFGKIDINSKFNIIIGPEGGFSKVELEILKKICFTTKLTNTILKSETAAIYLASLVSHHMRNKNEK